MLKIFPEVKYVFPPSLLNKYGVAPPVAEGVITPSSSPKQVTLEIVVNKSGFSPAKISAVSAFATHPFASEITTEYNPGNKKFIVGVVAPLLHKYEYPGVAPLAIASISPDANV